MKKNVEFSQQDISFMVSIIASLDPESFEEPAVVDLVKRCRALVLLLLPELGEA